MKNILVPIGSTENAQSTLQYAIDFAAEINANIIVFRAYKAIAKAGIMINMSAIIERETNLYLRAIVKSVDRKKVAIKLISSRGSVLESVEAVDHEIGVDLIFNEVGPTAPIIDSVSPMSISNSVMEGTKETMLCGTCEKVSGRPSWSFIFNIIVSKIVNLTKTKVKCQ